MKLKVGDIITVHGWVMLNKLDSGKYKVKSISKSNGIDVYDFTKPKGNKIIIRHFVDNVDLWVSDTSNPDLNKITVG